MGSGKAGAGLTSGIIIGAMLFLGSIILGIAAALVLSLIPLFPAESTQAGSGAEYKISSVLLKIIYTNTTSNFSNSTVAESTSLSTLCTSAFSSSSSDSTFSSCVLSDLRAFSGSNSSNITRRRRASDPESIYVVADVLLYFSTSCETVSDRGKLANASSISSCAKKRLASCNTFLNKTSVLMQWASTSSITLAAYDSSANSYTSLTVDSVYLVPLNIISSYVTSLSLDSGTGSQLTAGCQYDQPISTTAIAAAVSAQSSVTTTTASSNSSSG